MGAAKNARKARRKESRRKNRRPYFFDIETVHRIGPWEPVFDYTRSSVTGPSSIILTNPLTGKREEVGQVFDLTIQELSQLQAKGHYSRPEPKSWREHMGPWFGIDPGAKDFTSLYQRSTLGRSQFDQHFLQQILPPLNPPGAVASARRAAKAEINNQALHIIDFSDIEARMMEMLDKKAMYAAAYGATANTVRGLYAQAGALGIDLTADLMADPLDREYRGHNIRDIVESHPLNKGETDDHQDASKVEGVSGYSARAIFIDSP